MLFIHQLGYTHPNLQVLFNDLSITAHQPQKIGLVGNNGVGKSILLQLIAGHLKATEGVIQCTHPPFYVPQQMDAFIESSIATIMGVAPKLKALQSILNGSIDEKDYETLEDDWTIEEKCWEQISFWNVPIESLDQKFSSLSGGEKTKLFLAAMILHQSSFILLDEPTNHLDTASRQKLLDWIQQSKSCIIIVSHDRQLLNQMDEIWELTPKGISKFGGNYEFYEMQQSIQREALVHQIKNKELELKKAKQIAKESMERQNKLNARASKKTAEGGVPKIMINTWKNSGESSSAKLKAVHNDKEELLKDNIISIKDQLIDLSSMKLSLDNSRLHKGKIIIKALSLNYGYGASMLWKSPLRFEIVSGDRVHIKGSNGTGKSTLVKLITKQLIPLVGELKLNLDAHLYIDQEYTLIQQNLTVYEQAVSYNLNGKQEHEIKIYLTRFLFTKEAWGKPCSALSGGEKMRLLLCCMNIRSLAPDLIILDEPTNNLDIQSIEILAQSLQSYQGTLIIISHDSVFVESLQINQVLDLDSINPK